MKNLYIPQGKTLRYESLTCRNIIVDGALIVEKGITARHISGKGIVEAGSVSTHTLSIMSVEAATVTAATLAVERVCAVEVRVSGEALVSCYLEAEYAEAKKLTVAGFQVGELHVRDMEYLSRKNQTVLMAVLGSLVRRFVAFIQRHIPQDADYVQKDTTAPQNTERQTGTTPAGSDELDNDFEFLRLKAMYRLLKSQGRGYLLRIIPREDPIPCGEGASEGQKAA